MQQNEIRSPLGSIEDNNTIYTFTDWTSAAKMRNFRNSLLRVDVSVIRNLTGDTNEIKGYQITVYNVSTQVIVYKFYVNYIDENIWSFTTNEAISILNHIGFPCYFDEKVELTENTRAILESCQTLGYTHIKRVINTAEYLLINNEVNKNAEFVTGKLLSELLAETGKYINLYDLRAITMVPVSLKQLLK